MNPREHPEKRLDMFETSQRSREIEDYKTLLERTETGSHPTHRQLHAYSTDQLTGKAAMSIRMHIALCRRCAQEISAILRIEDEMIQELLDWANDETLLSEINAPDVSDEELRIKPIETEFEKACSHNIGEDLWQKYSAEPLSVTAVYDRNTPDLIHNYYQKPLMERLAASTESSGELTFPITVEYADGQIIGEFWRRAGHLFYRLKKSTIGHDKFVGILIYTSPSHPEKNQTFEIQEEYNKRIGSFREFVKTDTKQEMLNVMRRFRLFLKREE